MQQEIFTAFVGERKLSSGPLASIALAVKAADEPALIFNDSTGSETDVDLRGTDAEVAARYMPQPAGPGRPKLGVVAKEVTLLPRHWDWLKGQRGGASATIRQLVEAAVRDSRSEAKQSANAAYRFMSAIAGNFPGFEEASRALFAADAEKFASVTNEWPADIRDHARQLAGPALA